MLSDQDLYPNLKLQYLECIICGLVSINPLARFADINKRSFDGERNIVSWADLDYSYYESDKWNSFGVFYDRYNLEGIRKTNRVLDVSCGPGVSLAWLKNEKGWETWGIDPDRHSVRVALNRYGLSIENGLIDDVSAPPGHFDLIIMDNSLEHTFDPLGTLLSVFRFLRPGGALVIAVPNFDGLGTRYFNDNCLWGHWFGYRPRVLCNTVRRVGFSIAQLTATHPLKPELIEKGYDVEPFRKGLNVLVRGETGIMDYLRRGEAYSDFFDLLAIKPEQSDVSSPSEHSLRRIAESSLVERPSVRILC